MYYLVEHISVYSMLSIKYGIVNREMSVHKNRSFQSGCGDLQLFLSG